MPDSFGARLRQQREKQGIALQAIAKQTRIKESLLTSLEGDDVSQWPTGFYRRAFFRAYASAIQLDPDAAFREFKARHPEPPEADVIAAMASTLGRGDGPGRSTALRSAVGSALTSLGLRRNGAGEQEPEREPVPERQRDPDRTPAVPSVERNVEPRPVARASAPEPATRADVVETTPAAADSQSQAPPQRQPEAQTKPERPTGPVETEPDLLDLARLCSDLVCVTSLDETQPLLQKAAGMLDAAGLIVWAWHLRESQLEPALCHGYSSRVLAQLPMVRRDDENVTAVAFRTMQTRVFNDSANGRCALVVPMRTASGCVGVLAVELKRGVEVTRSRVAVATVLAAQLAPIADALSQPGQRSLPYAVNGAAQAV